MRARHLGARCMNISLTPESIVIFLIFVAVLVISYKLFKFVAKLIIVASLSFAFPWVVKFLNLPIPVSPDIETGVKFMLLGIGLFLLYEFWETVKKIFGFFVGIFKR